MNERNAIRERLVSNRLSFVWLIHQLAKRGIATDKSEVSSAFAGTRNGAKIDTIIRTSTAILDDYEKGFAYNG